MNRSQADINKNVDMIAARRKEREYFETSPEYGHLSHKMGSEYLAKLLSKVSLILSYGSFLTGYMFTLKSEKLLKYVTLCSAFGDCYQAADTKYHCSNK